MDSIVQIPADVYTLMFLCDLINFFVLMFGFSTFSVSSKELKYESNVHSVGGSFTFIENLAQATDTIQIRVKGKCTDSVQEIYSFFILYPYKHI